MASNVSGMAASIRAATESETFDLAGNNVSTITTTIQSAFATPLPITDMIRITFVTGAGKLGRQRYDENAAKTVTSTLRDLGFEEDRAASCVVECAGTFKSQHDTGKNLKTIVVFPNIVNVADLALDDNGAGTGGGSASGPPVLPDGSAEKMIAMSSPAVFPRMLSSKIQSWSQKKACSLALVEVKKIVQGLEDKLMSGTPFTDSEQEFYDAVSLDSLSQKEALVKTEMQKQVEEDKNITRAEKERLLHQVDEKIHTLEENIKEATKEKKMKKVEKLTQQKTKALERKDMLDNITPQPPHALKHEIDIRRLRKEMVPLLRLEKETKGRLLSIKETTAMSRKEEIEDEIIDFEERSRDWFESDEEFLTRVERSRATAKAQSTKKVVKKKPATSGGGGWANTAKKSSVTSFVTPASRNRATARKPAAKKAGGGGVFAAMMMDSDSDSD